MPKSILLKILFLILLFFTIPELKAQDEDTSEDTSPRNVLKTNILPMLMGPIPYTSELRLVYERALTKNHAIQLGASYLAYSSLSFVDISTDSLGYGTVAEDIDVSGYRGQLAYKYYLKPGAPKGFYFSPQLSYSYAKFMNSENIFDYVEARYINGVIAFGWQLIAGDVFALDMFTGIGYKSNTWKQSDPEDSIFDVEDLDRLGPKYILGINIGVAF